MHLFTFIPKNAVSTLYFKVKLWKFLVFSLVFSLIAYSLGIDMLLNQGRMIEFQESVQENYN